MDQEVPEPLHGKGHIKETGNRYGQDQFIANLFPFFHKGKNQHTKNDLKSGILELKPQKGQKVIRVHFKITEEVPITP